MVYEQSFPSTFTLHLAETFSKWSEISDGVDRYLPCNLMSSWNSNQMPFLDFFVHSEQLSFWIPH